MMVKTKVSQPKRLGAMVVAGTMLMQTVGSAYAGVSQLPGLFTTPPDANVMFTLDDSLSMLSDAIPDFVGSSAADTTARQAGMPNADGNSNASDALLGVAGQQFARFPGMWGANSLYLTTTFYRSDNAIARYMRSSSGNKLYYNPAVTYRPWTLATNDTLFNANADPTAVNIHQSDPFNNGRTLDLTVRVNESGGSGAADNQANNFWLGTYFVFNTAAGTMPEANPNNALNIAGNFTKYEIKPSVGSYPRAAARTDCTSVVGACSYAEERQNFANWLQYYHSRLLMAKGGVAGAFAQQSTNLRVGIGSLNSAGTLRQGVAGFAGARRESFYTDLYAIPPSGGGTPLRRAVGAVGEYFSRSDVGNPWADDPTRTTGAVGNEYTCRKSFHILSTDGYWNGAAAGNAAAQANNDSFTGNTPPKGAAGGTTYAFSDTATSVTDSLVGRFTINPFADGATTQSNTLADVAAYYWRNDLRTDLNNDVFTSNRDPAFWQHVTMYTVGLGISGTGGVTAGAVPVDLSTKTARDSLIANKTALTWTTSAANEPTAGDDLIHAAMNGRGDYFLATDPTSLRNGLAAALAEAGNNPGSLASVATESAQVSVDTEVYQATYNPSQWSGRLYAFSQSASGTVNTNPSAAMWEASNRMPSPANRNIYTWNPTTNVGAPFTWAGLTATQQGHLNNDSTLLDFLRGSNAREVAQNGPFRDRARYAVGAVSGGVLGDIVNGSPIKGPSAGAGYNRLPPGAPGRDTYATFRSPGNTGLNNMRDSLFVGANDGMLHAFNRLTGVERFAYVPNSVFSVPRSPTGTEQKLRMLSDPGYTHRFTVDGPPQIADAFIGVASAAADWRTVLLGSTGAGARSVFAMDITNPAVETGGFGQGRLLWEFSEANNADMGYMLSYPHAARMRDGTWVAIFGNGYDSVNGQAKLFILNLQTGAVVWQQSVGAAGGNGLSQPNFSLNANREVTAIYAGDLRGNLWKFDVDDPSPTNWKVAFGTGPNYTPLFTGSTNQPITVMPEISDHPNGGTLLSFGTGKLFEVEDTATTSVNVNLNTQAIYGIWDKPAETTGFSGNSLLVQQGANTGLAAVADTTLSGTTTNTINWGTRRGWYMNLATGGERVNVSPQQAKSTLLLVANTPDTNPCRSGGSSRLFALDPITGGAPNFAVFDTNAVGGVTSADAKGYNVKSIAFAVLSLPTLQRKTGGSDAVTTEAAGSRGQTGARLGGVEKNKPTSATDCAQWLLAGGSDTSIAGFDISLCSPNKPRISWRQLK
jgi:type IV pilus assembly protein PilY1